MGAFDDLIPQAAAPAGGAFDDLIPAAPKADPKIGQPEELTWWEKLASNAPDSWAATKGGKVGGLVRGGADLGVAAAQIAANVVGAGKPVNDWVAAKEKEYQDARAIEGRDGFDAMRTIGNVAVTAPVPFGAAAKGGAGILKAAGVGGATGALNPVTEGDFWGEKGKQVGIGAATGAVLSPLMGALARVVSPNASIDPAVKLLRDEKVETSLGQTLGGWANVAEQKATSVPILGDFIANARNRGVESFNTAAANRAVAPVGGKVAGAGHETVKEAGDILSAAYNKAADDVGHINFATPQTVGKLAELEDMVRQGFTPDMAKKFEGIADRFVAKRLSPNGSIVGADLKKVDSDLGKIAADWRASSLASEREFGDAVRQLQQVVRDGMADASPAYKAAKDAADEGWRSLKTVRKAAGSAGAANNEGVFSPAQLMSAIKAGDRSLDKRATAEGAAWMQDLASAGQRLGTKIADSGTAGRLGQIAAIMNPKTLIPIAAGSVAYTRPVQNVLRTAVLKRPKNARKVANSLRDMTVPLAYAGALSTREQ